MEEIIFDPVKLFKDNLINCFNSKNGEITLKLTDIIKCNKNNLNQYGEFMFPTSSFIWHKSGFPCDGFCGNHDRENNIFSCKLKKYLKSDDKKSYLKETYNELKIPIKDIRFVNDDSNNEKCCVFLDKKATFNYIFNQVLVEKIYGELITCIESHDFEKLDESTKTLSLSMYRNHLLKTTLDRILKCLNVQDIENNTKISNYLNVLKIVNASVLDPITGKCATMNVEEYMNLRKSDMQLIAMHKHGIRPRQIKNFDKLILHLGDAAVKIDLLEVKPSSPVKVVRNGQGNTKGASFILYNSARLETLLEKFSEKVDNGVYPPLPPLNEIDFSLLKEEEEWKLLFVYVMGFPNMIKRCLEGFEQGNCSIHFLIQYLQGLVLLFSVYYRRSHILMDYRSHLMPTIYARIYLLKVLQQVLNKSLSLLNIKPIQYM